MAFPLHFTFSQSSLQDYADCARRFQLRYVLGVHWPSAYDEPAIQREHQARQGIAFHHLIHQHSLEIPVEVLDATVGEGDLRRWWKAYLDSPPAGLPTGLRRAEVQLSMPFRGHRLAAQYDLIAVAPSQKAVIVDWKTNPQRSKRAWLETRWQTCLYSYILVEAGAHLNDGGPISPAQVEMVYWFANFPTQTERFSYDAEQHRETAHRLGALMDDLSSRQEAVWPLTDDLQTCKYCTYRTLCNREKAGRENEDQETDSEDSLFDFELDLEQVAEIEF